MKFAWGRKKRRQLNLLEACIPYVPTELADHIEDELNHDEMLFHKADHQGKRQRSRERRRERRAKQKLENANSQGTAKEGEGPVVRASPASAEGATSKTVATEIVSGLARFLSKLKSDQPIEATRITRYETPDGPMHMRQSRPMPGGGSRYTMPDDTADA